jgi:hypothetical protein
MTVSEPRLSAGLKQPVRNWGDTIMKIGVLGSGDVAKALGGGFLKHGH